ncbi:MAG TPA: glycosyltransferase family 39 protein [Candidatus Limnocylindrales bacterium]|nr:glycosyltransferase family 39 protein [Candidatus Limnocylindrales bacterium]
MKFTKKKISNILLAIILLFAAFLRLYKISDYMTFLGDEGRDVLVVKDILAGNLTFLGPRSSAGDFYTGPIYYYMMAPFLYLSNLDPVGPAVMIALLGIATVFMVFYVGKKVFNSTVGVIAAALYAVSPLVIIYSRSSWNPNPMPFFTLLILYLLYQAVQNKSWKYFLTVGFLYGIALQLHYIELFVGIIIISFILFSYYFLKRKEVSLLIKQYAFTFVGFVLGLSPFLAFEIHHGFPNTRTVVNLILHGSPGATDITNKSFIEIVLDVFFRVFARTIWYFPSPDRVPFFDKNILVLWQIIIVIIALASIYLLMKFKNRLIAVLFGMWLGFGVILFGFYKKPINDYNFEFLFPLPFLLTAYFIYSLYQLKKPAQIGKVLAVTIFIFIFFYNLNYQPFKFQPNKQKDQIKIITEFVISKTDNKPYNFALIAAGNSDHGYRYYFDILGHSPSKIENPILDPERKTPTKQLLVVCEQTDCNPLGHPLFDIAGFGRAQVVGTWDVSVVKVFKLIPYVENQK